MSQEAAQNLADEFIEPFGEDAWFWTHTVHPAGPSVSWSPATDHTFDAAVAVRKVRIKDPSQ
jgi:hypothetical protein